MKCAMDAIVSPLSQLPDPASVRRRLAEVTREQRLLRQMLRVVEQAHGHRNANDRSGVKEVSRD